MLTEETTGYPKKYIEPVFHIITLCPQDVLTESGEVGEQWPWMVERGETFG